MRTKLIFGLLMIAAIMSTLVSTATAEDTHEHTGHDHDHGDDNGHDHVHPHDLDEVDHDDHLVSRDVLLEAITETVARDFEEFETPAQVRQVLDHQLGVSELAEEIRSVLGDDSIAGITHSRAEARSTLYLTAKDSPIATRIARTYGDVDLVFGALDLAIVEAEALAIGERLRADPNVGSFSIAPTAHPEPSILVHVAEITNRVLPAARSHIGGHDPRITVQLETVPADSFLNTEEGAVGGEEIIRNTPQGAGIELDCTTGFSVTRFKDSLLTAEHCQVASNPGSTVHYRHENSALHNIYTVRVANASELLNYGDFRLVRTPADERPHFYYNPGLKVRVDGFIHENNLGLNQIVCHFGRATSAMSCARIQQLNYTKLAGTKYYGNLVVTDDDHAQQGDSGGPWFFVDLAIGIHHGNHGGTPPLDAFSPVSAILQAWGLTLKT